MITTIELVANGLAVVTWFIFIVWYHARSKWYENQYGKNLMGVAIAIFALMALQLFTREAGWLAGVYTVFFLNIAALGVERTVLMERVQQQADKFATLSMTKGE